MIRRETRRFPGPAAKPRLWPWLALYFAVLLAAAWWFSPARAQGFPPPALCLVLVQDTSSSLDDLELDQMRAGLAGALTDPRLASSFGSSRVQVMVVSYAETPQVAVDWFTANPDTLASAALRILDMPRVNGLTATGDAIAFAVEQLDRVQCTRQVIDVATDGESNAGRSPKAVTSELDPGVVQVNGLVIGNEANVARFEATTQFGFSAFTVHAAGFDDFGLAMLRKLSIEIGMNTPETEAL